MLVCMADPIISGGIRVQFILPGRSGLPEDKYITTWAFRTEANTAPSPADLLSAADRVAEFFQGMTAPATTTIANLLGTPVDLPNCSARVYKLGDTPPRQPTIVNYNLGPVPQANSLPSEVAVCASFFAGVNLPRRRGRVYIGPLTVSTGSSETGTGIVRPTVAIQRALTTSMKRLQANAVTSGLRWCVLSQVDAALKDITAGWADNAYDTQRRRGEDASARETWSSF